MKQKITEIYRCDDGEFVLTIDNQYFNKIFNSYNELKHIAEFLETIYKEIPPVKLT